MISISVVGRLAQQPELQLLGDGSQVCEFTLLSSRHYYQQEITESVTFFCYGDVAEQICSTTVLGQEMSATGTQETRIYQSGQGERKKFVKYRLSWFRTGRRPYNADKPSPKGRAGIPSQAATEFKSEGSHKSEFDTPMNHQKSDQRDVMF